MVDSAYQLWREKSYFPWSILPFSPLVTILGHQLCNFHLQFITVMSFKGPIVTSPLSTGWSRSGHQATLQVAKINEGTLWASSTTLISLLINWTTAKLWRLDCAKARQQERPGHNLQAYDHSHGMNDTLRFSQCTHGPTLKVIILRLPHYTQVDTPGTNSTANKQLQLLHHVPC